MNQKLHRFLTTLACALWLVGKLTNVYQYAALGAIFEILWLPLLIGITVLFVIAILYWKKENFILRSYYLQSIMSIIAAVLITFFVK